MSQALVDISNLLNKKINSRDVTADGSTTDGNLEEELSDIESEGTNLEEDEDSRMTSDEMHKKLEKILKSAYQNKMLIEQSSNSLRATCYGQDRYWRRYWHLPRTGGIFVEGLDSAQSEILKYHNKLEEIHNQNEALRNKQNQSECENKRRGKKRKLSLTDEPLISRRSMNDSIVSNRSVTSNESKELNETEKMPCDAQNIDDGENRMVTDDESIERDSEPMESEHKDDVSTTDVGDKVNHNQNEVIDIDSSDENTKSEKGKSGNNDMLDIKDSIPKTILVQKANETDQPGDLSNANVQLNNHSDANNIERTSHENIDTHKMNCDTKLNLEIDGNVKQKPIILMIDLDAIGTIAVQPIDPIKMETLDGINEIKMEIKEEFTDEDMKREEPILDKWFSIANREIQLSSMETTIRASMKISLKRQ